MPIVEFIIVQTIVFLGVLYVLRRIMIRDTASAVNRLRIADEENANRLAEMKKRIAEAEDEFRRRSTELDEALATQREEAMRQLEEEKKRALALSREEGERILDTAKGRAEKIDHEIEHEVRTHAVVIVGTAVRQVFSERLRGALNDQLVDELLEEMAAADIGYLPEEIREVEIILPYAPAADLKKKIKAILEKKLTRKIEVRETVRQEIGGGMILRLGSLVMDGSLEGKVSGIVHNLKRQV